MTTSGDGVTDVQALIEVVRVLDGLLRAAASAGPADVPGLAADADALGAALDRFRIELEALAAVGLDVATPPATLTRAVAAALAATDLHAAVHALRSAPVTGPVAVAALRVRLTLALRLCTAALAGLAGREAP